MPYLARVDWILPPKIVGPPLARSRRYRIAASVYTARRNAPSTSCRTESPLLQLAPIDADRRQTGSGWVDDSGLHCQQETSGKKL